MHVVATAGHVDHGKSTLVRALTGTDPDRLAEEKQRGLTIDLGFAWTSLPSGRVASFVDVPGHVRFLKNMLAGVGAVDACVFVVDAAEGWKPQSEEHLRILELLGLRSGLVALTKADLVDADGEELARLDVAERVAGTFLDRAPVVAVDAASGRGVDDVVHALDALLADTPTAADTGRPRLWVDRSFAAHGSGTVVTGTLLGGSLATDDEVLIEPGGRRARVRSLQTHGDTIAAAGPGRRLAVNLAGVSHHDVARGDAVVRPDQWVAARTLDASLTVLGSVTHEVRRRGAYKAHLGSGEHAVAVRVLGSDAIEPGEQGLVRLHLPAALPLVMGDRYVLRESGRGETVGGGVIYDVVPVRPASKARPDDSVDRIVAEHQWIEADRLQKLTGRRIEPSVGVWIVAPDALRRVQDDVAARIDAAGPLGLDVSLLDDRQRAVLGTVEGVTVADGRARRADTADPLASHPFVAALEASPFAPPSAAECGIERGELRALVQRGYVVERDGMHFSPAAVEAAARVVAQLLATSPDGVTASDIRQALGTTRKYLLPLLALLDTSGVTRRRGDLRIAGPRLPAAQPEAG
ncbi:MAG TPA: selenocysteine-specific translation elongation factor [Acidimicrobiales bacterium]|nr:selenocysteine-specific translation elongation factor [Acidimicrobiales bacterium]